MKISSMRSVAGSARRFPKVDPLNRIIPESRLDRFSDVTYR
jgi:hypothetical protein